MTRRRRPVPLRRLPRSRRPVVLLLVALIVLAMAHWLSPVARSPVPEPLGPESYLVERVVDGDTLVLTGYGKVRLIGVDSPETFEPWGLDATQFTRQFVAGGEVQLQFDGPLEDRYRRPLVHVWVGERMLAEELIRAGLATAETGYDFAPAIKARFREAQAEARTASRGIWSRQRP
jgi:micrococcal nuclease